MSKIVAFPLHRAIRAPDACRARPASEAKSAAETPAFLTRGRARMVDHQTAGMESRSHHLSMAATVSSPEASSSVAIAERDDQSSMMARKDRGAGMQESIRQIVCNHKVKVSGDGGAARGQKPLMTTASTKSGFKAEFLARTKQARVARGYTQAEMEVLLGLSKNTYKWYESRSFLPHDLIPRFCLLTDVEPGWLYGDPVAHSGRADAPRRRRRQKMLARKAKVA
jgi:DNA-binding XRE family transcriptional regulator